MQNNSRTKIDIFIAYLLFLQTTKIKNKYLLHNNIYFVMREFVILFLCFTTLHLNIAFAIALSDTDVVDTSKQTEDISTQDTTYNNLEEKVLENIKESTLNENEKTENTLPTDVIEISSSNTETDDGPDKKISVKDVIETKGSTQKTSTNTVITEENIVRINEVLPNPIGTDTGNEFVEIYNDSDKDISLENWKLYDKTEKYYIFGDVEIKSHGFVTLYNKKDFSFALNNSDETVFLEDAHENIMSEFTYRHSSEGLSWNYGDTWYLEGSTPNNINKENPLTKEYPEIVINEIFPNPIDDEENTEFIELYNPTNEDVSLKNWLLKDASISGTHIIEDITIPANNYKIFYRSEFSFALNNSGEETISLIAPNSKTISSISYTATREGFSLNRADKWYWHKPTPLKINNENPLTKTYPQLLLSEILPNPIGDENTDEYIEIYNPNDFAVNLEFWTLQDASATGTYTFTESLLIDPRSYYTLYRKTFLFALNNSNEQLSLIAPNEKIMSHVSYKSSRENISYNYEFSSTKWRWSKYLTPNQKNIFNNLPEITKFDIDEKIYKSVYGKFEAKAQDNDQEELKVRWDFGDGHKSYKWDTRHKYTETGTFHGSLRIQDESEEVLQEFIVTVKKFPGHKVTVTKIVPNPSGKDSGNEYIVIKNKENERINLKNWSIAAGSTEKTLVNHPVYDDLYIKPGKTKIITKKHAAISLPNKMGVIEIRRPNGSVSQKIKYGDENTSIPDNASYEKIDGAWLWITPAKITNDESTNLIIAHALHNEKMFSQQLLEQKIAQKVVYEHKQNDQDHTKQSKNHLTSFFEKLNQTFHKMILSVNTKIKRFQQKDRILVFSKKYPIPHNNDPCANPRILLQKTYNFCK